MNYNNFNVGDIVIISNYPNSWSSHCAPIYPGQLPYPIKAKIKEIKKCDSHVATSMEYNNIQWGFSLDELIEKNYIKHDIVSLRKKKIKKLDEL